MYKIKKDNKKTQIKPIISFLIIYLILRTIYLIYIL